MKEQRSRDMTTTVVLSLVLGILVALLAVKFMEQRWLWVVVGSIFFGFCVSGLLPYTVQNKLEGTSAALRQNWKPILKSWCFYLCPAAAVVTGLIFEWIK